MSSHLTNMGIPGIGVIPYGLHVCHFYASHEEMLAGLIPYFQAGLENNEKCFWITSEPLPSAAVSAELAKYSDLQDALTAGQLHVYDASEWYGDPAALNADTIIARWQENEKQALAEGYSGLRVTGNTSFVPRENWRGLLDYERKLHRSLQGRRIVVCCSYHRLTCEAVDIIEVARSHDGALDSSGEGWQIYLQQPAVHESTRHSVDSNERIVSRASGS